MTVFPLIRWILAGAIAGLAGPAQACEALLAEIDAKIRASGASGYGLVVMGAQEPTTGRVVGSCGQGSKKIVYTPPAGAPLAGAAPARGSSGLTTGGTMSAPVLRSSASRASPEGDILTECKPGFFGPDCRRRIAPAAAPASAAGGAAGPGETPAAAEPPPAAASARP